MKLAVDLHSHSSYAGGVGKIRLDDISAIMKMKGIDVFGTGDCLCPARTAELASRLQERFPGLYSLTGDESLFLLQTEVIFTTRLPGHKNRIIAHHLLLFPDFAAIHRVQELFSRWQVKNTIGRPFLTSTDRVQLQDQMFSILGQDQDIELIPAHIMTPDGVYGSRNNLGELLEFYGDFLPNIHAIETGLSADPSMLEKIPDLADRTFISGSDCHSAALNRIGREFTILEATDLSYVGIVRAIRGNQVVLTAEFHPAEGKYYLTGHRSTRPGHKHSLWYEESTASGGICPVCGKTMLSGVKQRCSQLQDDEIKPLPRKFLYHIPLIEIIALTGYPKKKTEFIYKQIIEIAGSEIALWQSFNLQELLDKSIDPQTIKLILAVKNGDFFYDPPGFDGLYGKLYVGAENGN